MVGWNLILFFIFLEPRRTRWKRFVTHSREEPFMSCWLHGCQRSHFSACRPEDWKQKGYFVSPPPHLPPDRFFLFNQQVKRETRGREKIIFGKRAKWWGRAESQKLQYRKSVLGVGAAESLQQGREASKTLAVISTPPASLFSSLRASGSFGFPLPPSDHIHYFPQDNTIKLVFTDILSSQPEICFNK